jgi:hypothetical protein
MGGIRSGRKPQKNYNCNEAYLGLGMNKPLRPTAEAIEAAFSAYDSQHEEGTVHDDGLEFIKIMLSSDRLNAEIHGVADFVRELDLPADFTAQLTPEDVRFFKVNMLCDLFFWIGWHSRGAVEEADQLKRMVE